MIFFGMEGSSCFSVKQIKWNWNPPRHLRENGTFCWAVLWRTKIWSEVNGDLQAHDDFDKKFIFVATHNLIFSFEK